MIITLTVKKSSMINRIHFARDVGNTKVPNETYFGLFVIIVPLFF